MMIGELLHFPFLYDFESEFGDFGETHVSVIALVSEVIFSDFEA